MVEDLKNNIIRASNQAEKYTRESSLFSGKSRTQLVLRIIPYLGFLLVMLKTYNELFLEFGPSSTETIDAVSLYILLLAGGALLSFWFALWFAVGFIFSTSTALVWSKNVQATILIGSIIILLGSVLTGTFVEFRIGMSIILIGNVMVILPTIHQRIVRGKEIDSHAIKSK